MAKIIMGVEEILNLKLMLNSSDDDNKNIAFMAIENSDIKNSVNALFILYKFVPVSAKEWKTNCPKMISHLETLKFLEPLGANSSSAPSMPVVFHKLLQNKAKKEVMLLFLDLHNKHLMDVMKSWGYPTDKFELSMKLNDDAE